MKNDVVKRAFSNVLGTSADDLLSELQSFSTFSPKMVDGMTNLIGLLRNFTDCVDISVEAVPTESVLELRANELREQYRLLGGM